MKASNPRILAINGGSSSIKFALFDRRESPRRIKEGAIEGIGSSSATFSLKGSHRLDTVSRKSIIPDYKSAVNVLMEWIENDIEHEQVFAIGHRVVHGGPSYCSPERITRKMLDDLHTFKAFDPDHMPEELLLIEAFFHWFPNVPQIACFDTEFHKDLPRIAKIFPIPRRYERQGLRRYGFHGISCMFLMEELRHLLGEEAAKSRVILAHLGSGSSITAVRNGKSVETSMGFTPTSGIPMGTRSGDLDPGLNLFLSKTEGLDTKQFNDMVNFQSGLLGVSESSSNMQELLKKELQDERAAEAIALFCYQIKKWIGAFAAVLGGIDILVFSGGIGENAPSIRAKICDHLEFLGIEIEEKKNKTLSGLISSDTSRVMVYVIHTDEEWMIAKTVCRVL